MARLQKNDQVPFLYDSATGRICGIKHPDGSEEFIVMSNVKTGTPVNGVKAVLTSDMTNANADVTLTAVNYGADGNRITVTYVDPGAINQSLKVLVNGENIIVNLDTNGAGAITSICNAVVAAINAHEDAKLLVVATAEGTGLGVVNAKAIAYLAGGVTCTPGVSGSSLMKDSSGFLWLKTGEQTWTSFTSTIVDATTTVKGVVELATNAETVAIADTERAVTPDDLGYFIKRIPPYMGIVSSAAYESAPLGDELLSSSGWTSTDWTGDFASGFDHNTGNTTALLNSLAAVSGNYYQIAFTVSGRTAGTFTITFGGQTSADISATGTWGPKATSTGSLSITPTSTFDGTIVISIKQITGAYAPVYKILNSAAGLALEIRSTTNNLYNTFIGISVGRYNTTGSYNTALGHAALCFNTTGYNNTALGYAALYYNTTGNYNTAIGYNALYSNTTGYQNTAVGDNTLYYNTTGYNNTALGHNALCSNTTGNYNTAIGLNALYSNTTGYQNTAVGQNAGRFAGSGTTSNETSTNSVYLGYNTRSSASGNTNEIVMGYSAVGNGSNTVTLGNTSVTGWYMGATKLIGVQGAAVADASGAGDVVAQLNTLLARLRTHGLIAS